MYQCSYSRNDLTGKGLTSWLFFVMLNCVLSLSHEVWYLVVSIPDLCHLSYYVIAVIISAHLDDVVRYIRCR